jgi:hypothetical protein
VAIRHNYDLDKFIALITLTKYIDTTKVKLSLCLTKHYATKILQLLLLGKEPPLSTG